MKKLAIIFILIFHMVSTYAIDNIWTGDDAAQARWDRDGNWSLGHVPISTEDVIINGTGLFHNSHTINIFNSNDFTINSLTLNVPLSVDGLAFELSVLGSLTIENDIVFGSESSENGIYLNKSNLFLVKGDIVFSAGNDNLFTVRGVSTDLAVAEFNGSFVNLEDASFSLINNNNNITFNNNSDTELPASTKYGDVIFKGNGSKTIVDGTTFESLDFPDSNQDVIYSASSSIIIEQPTTNNYNVLTLNGSGIKNIDGDLIISDTMLINTVDQPKVNYNSESDQNVINSVYYDLSFNKTGKKTISDSISVIGTFSVANNTEIVYDSDKNQYIYPANYTFLRFSGLGTKYIGGSTNVQVRSTGNFIANINPVADPFIDTTQFVNISQYESARLILNGPGDFNQSILGFDSDDNQTIRKNNDIHYYDVRISGGGVKNINGVDGPLYIDRSLLIESNSFVRIATDTIILNKDFISKTSIKNITTNSTGTVHFTGSDYDSDIKGDIVFAQLILSKSGKKTIVHDSLTIRHGGNVSITSASDELIINDGASLVLNTNTSTNTYATISEITAGAIVTGDVTAKQYINPSSRTWYQFTNPVNTIVSDWQDDFFITGDFIGSDDVGGANKPSIYTYNEGHAFSHIDSGWVAFPSSLSDPIEQGKGYRVFLRDDLTDVSPKTLEVTGDLNYGSISVPLTYDDNGESGSDGWNFVGNPYPATIDWIGINKDDLGDLNAYVWNGNQKDWNNSSTDYSNEQIAAFQGFWVQSKVGGGTLNFNESDKSLSTTRLLRTELETNVIHLSLFDKSDSQIYNFASTKLVLDAYSTEGFDRDLERSYLSRNMFNEPGDDNLLDIATVMSNGRKLKENHIPESEEIQEVALYTEYSSNKSYLLELNLENFDESVSLFLYDSFLNEYTPITENVLSHDIELTTEESRSSNRFSLFVGGQPLNIDDDLESSFSVFPNPVINDVINIKASNLGQELSINLYNSVGILVYTDNVKSVNSTFIKEISLSGLNLDSGIYTVTVRGTNTILNDKLVIE